MLLEGIFLPLTTPFHPDGRVALRKLEHNVARYAKTPAAGMLVLSRIGEAGGLTDDERHAVVRVAIAAASDDKVMIAVVGAESVFATLALAAVAASAGYDVVAVSMPRICSDETMRDEVLTYFRAVADQVALPVLLLSQAGQPLDAQTVAALALHQNIIGLIDEASTPQRVAEFRSATTGVSREVTVTTTFAAVTARMLKHVDTGNGFVSLASLTAGVGVAGAPVTQALKTRVKRVGFQIIAGSTATMLDSWGAGAVGAVPALSAAAPQACCEVWQAYKDGDQGLAEEKQHRIHDVGLRMAQPDGLPALKYGCDLNGYFGGRTRLPLLALTAGQRDAVEAALFSLKN